MNKKSCCINCRHRHDYYRRKLKSSEAWCCKLGKFFRNKKNCIHIEFKEQQK